MGVRKAVMFGMVVKHQRCFNFLKFLVIEMFQFKQILFSKCHLTFPTLASFYPKPLIKRQVTYFSYDSYNNFNFWLLDVSF